MFSIDSGVWSLFLWYDTPINREGDVAISIPSVAWQMPYPHVIFGAKDRFGKMLSGNDTQFQVSANIQGIRYHNDWNSTK